MSDLVERRVTVEVPASSANLGPGFDCLALALDMWLRVTVEVVDGQDSWQGKGEAEGLSFGAENRVVRGLMAGFAEAAIWPRPALRVEMDSAIPMRRGLGSSAAATVAGLLSAQALAGTHFDTNRLIGMATDIEGHPDNAAAALMGGFVLVADGRATRLDPPAGLRCVLFVPERELSTDEMRAVLPDSVSLEDAVSNAAGVGVLVAAFATADLTLLGVMGEDRLHEPYRAKVYPELLSLKAAALEAGAFGCALSGAGSSILALSDAAHAQTVALSLNAAAQQIGLAGTARMMSPALAGARLIHRG